MIILLTRSSGGPIIEGLLSQSSAGWRWSFYLNLLAGGVVIPIYLFLLPPYRPRSGLTALKGIWQVDAVGFTLWAGALVSWMMILSFGGAEYNWSSGQMIGFICCTAILWICFALQQGTSVLMVRASNIFPVSVAKSLEVWLLGIQTAISIGSLFFAINYLPLYLIHSR